MEQVIDLIIPFIALAFLSVMIDKFTLFLEQIVHKIPHFPDYFEWYTAYAVVLIISTMVCWQGDFRFFDYLNLYFPVWLDYFMSGLVISGGSAFVRTQFSMIEAIPSTVTGIASSFTRLLPGRKDSNVDQSNNNSTAPNKNSQPNVTPNYTEEEYYPPATEEIDTNSNRYTDDI
ncbi:gp24 [Bacillus phage G]|uniref:Gp24 n=1 Tax=Bacillus phage G TaxID=2884420 RepID=G3MB94_9CAUD|nr:gp24 [Bacillus phage G]AEO93295.1 gp24 [Bacillus phage G]